ncbi:histidine kinase [Clostridium botulinum]|uniref:histidine kinase n=1 Tax=Clostridium botulinum C/D str. DC5 TaxID=1443128 RepID=A0A0A0I708_CLOBO|nr:HAMP domain-containing sensor histidine kinase [Clostridium botulinum]KEI04416.1 histidine kinase [Clostridium botulinum C/D str. BKT75002]KEI11325.1 histidine kinase [Clostridium botulinum C/D str. BKT2873]KGM97189.1 histidine kinase [Clostridium botulinum C/D str. DC5]KOC55337.1 histidine kinase [Clostridium botulinum]KOC56792.1 histidine kinase [Clostridium botulinum]
MSLNIKTKLKVIFSMFISTCLGFDLYILFKYKNITLAIEVAVFSAILVLIKLLYLYTIKKYGQQLLSQLYDMISALIDMRNYEVFSILNDDMLSKLQSQVIKLKGILNMKNKRLKKERDEIKSLISDISHQLKTPVANLKIYFELLQDDKLSHNQRQDFINNIKSQLNKFSFLMDNMIKLSRLESGIIVLNSQMESLNKTCLSAIKQVYQKALNKNIEIYFKENEDVFIKHDPNWTTEAIFNILDNAVKYTQPYGKVTIRIEKYEIYTRVDIIDNGPGILEVDINNIFKRFYRGNNSLNEEGVGIGLYLARKIITKQDGYTKVTSQKGKGSKFSLFLPLISSQNNALP